MSIYDRLHEDHERIRATLRELLAPTTGTEKSRAKKFARLKRDLEDHAGFENTVFYPAIGENPDAKSIVDRAMDEHERIEAALDDLDEIDSTASEWADILHELEGMLGEHIEEEENEIFAIAREVIDDERAEEMARQ